MAGISLSHLDEKLEQNLFLQLRAATVDAHLKETPPAAHVIEAANRFIDDIPQLVKQTGSYCITDSDEEGFPVVVAWHLEYRGTLGIDLHPDDLTFAQQQAMCRRTPKGCDARCSTQGHHYEIYTPSETRAMGGMSYMVPVFVDVKREVYLTKRQVMVEDEAGESVQQQISTYTVDALQRLLFRATQQAGDKRGRYLYSQIKSQSHPLFAHLEYRDEFSGLQCSSAIRIPRVIGSKGCIMSRTLRQGVVDENLRTVIPPYTLQDYARLGEDPDDTGGYMLIQGGEYVIRLTNRGATNQFLTTVSEKNDVKNFKTMIRIHTPEMDPLDVETCYVISGYPRERGSISIPLRNISKRIPAELRQQIDPRFKLLWFGASWLFKTVPVSILFYALGAYTDRDLFALMGAEHCLNIDDKERTYQCVCDTVEMGKYLCLKEVELVEGLSDRDKLVLGARSVLASAFRVNKHERKNVKKFKWRISFFESRIIDFIMRQVRTKNSLGKMAACLKSAAVSHMCIRTVRCMAEVAPLDDVDHIGNQRIYGVYEFMSHLLVTTTRHTLASITDFCYRQYAKGKFNVYNETLLAYPTAGWNFNGATNRFLYCIKTGTIKHNDHPFTGITARINRISRYAAQASVQNISSTIDPKSKTTKPRQVHSTHWGVICPVDTSEGERCGLNKHKAIGARVSVELSKPLFRELLGVVFATKHETKAFQRDDQTTFDTLRDSIGKRHFPIVINGVVWGFARDPTTLCARVNEWRDKGFDRITVSCVLLISRQVVEIRTLFGRMMRPLFKVLTSEDDSRNAYIPVSKSIMHALNGSRVERARITTRKLYDAGTITFTDVLQQENMLIGMDPRQLEDHPREFLQRMPITHFEIDPSLIFGLRGSLLAFPSHSPTPRDTYYIQMKSAAVSVPMMNKLDSNETTIYELCYPQRSLTLTRMSEYSGMYDNPDSQQVFVLVGVFTGYNQEDAIIVNQSAVDMGLGLTTVYKRFVLRESRATGSVGPDQPPLGEKIGDVVLGNPSKLCQDVRESRVWRKMNDKGQLSQKDPIHNGDPIIGAYKVVPVEEDYQMSDGRIGQRIVHQKVACPVIYKGDSGATIHRICVDTDKNGIRRAVVHVVFTRNLTVGDKLSEPNQKNTVGMLFRREDMPFAGGPEGINGMVPDYIMNPHAFPSRTTLSPLMQVVHNYNNVQLGIACNGTAFRSHGTIPGEKDNIYDACKSLGLTPFATVPFRNPYTGKFFLDDSGFPRQFTFGMMEGHRLKHMVADKIQSAARATKDSLTRQPQQGKSRGGAIRFGEMERDAAIAHGASFALKDALFHRSDAYVIDICDSCHLPAFRINNSQGRAGIGRCINPDCYSTTNNTTRAQMPYAAKLLFQELMAMGVSTRFYFDKEENQAPTRSTSFNLSDTLSRLSISPAPSGAGAVLSPKR